MTYSARELAEKGSSPTMLECRALRKSLGLFQREAAAEIGISLDALARNERGLSNISKPILLKINAFIRRWRDASDREKTEFRLANKLARREKVRANGSESNGS